MFPVILDSPYITLYSYPLFMGLAWGTGLVVFNWILEKRSEAFPSFWKIFIGLFLSAWLGAKLLFLLSSADEIHRYASSQVFWMGGGFVFYGGLIGALIFYLFCSLILEWVPFKKGHLFLAPLAISHGVGRLGCFLTGCCYGVQCEWPWAIWMHGQYRHPVQLYEACLLLFLGWILLKKTIQKKSALEIFNFYFLGYSSIRFSLEFFRGDLIRGQSLGLSTSQWISLGLVLIYLGVLLYQKGPARLKS